MPSQLYNNSAIYFICARNFTYAGHDYKIGSEFPQDKAVNLEVLVRSRRVIPVIDDWDDKPRHWYREVRLKSEVMGKLKTTQGESLLNREEQIKLDTPDDVEPGAFDEWEETPDNAEAIHSAMQKNIEEDEEMGTHEVQYVNGKEESEPVEMLGLGEKLEDVKVEVKTEEQNVPEYSKAQKALLDGDKNPDDLDVAPDNSTEPVESFNPTDHSAKEVNDYLKDASDTEIERVIAVERKNKNRKSVVGDDGSDEE